jgi:hypothetical protein
MKRKGLRVALALMLSLVLLLGTVGVAEARGNPHRSMVFEIIQDNSGLNILLKAHYDWDGYRTYGYRLEWWEFVGGEWVFDSAYDWDYGQLTTSAAGYTYRGAAVYAGETWQARYYFVRKNGNVWKKEVAWYNYTVQPKP